MLCKRTSRVSLSFKAIQMTSPPCRLRETGERELSTDYLDEKRSAYSMSCTIA